MDEKNLEQIITALLFASEEPLSIKKISSIVEDVSRADVDRAIREMQARLESNFPSIRLESVAGGLQLTTNPEFSKYVALLYSGKRKQRLSKAAMETVAIIAYKQPITRANVENLRGVGCGGVITTLMERSLIRITGKARVLGAPFLYGTTHEFLEYLGLNSLKDLPSMEQLESMLEHEEALQPELVEGADNDAGEDAMGDGGSDQMMDADKPATEDEETGKGHGAAFLSEDFVTESSLDRPDEINRDTDDDRVAERLDEQDQ